MQNHDFGQIRASGLRRYHPYDVRRLPRRRFPQADPMLYAVLQFLHVMAVILWVGGMLFAHCFLRPAAAKLEPPVRLRLLASVLGPFLNAVLVAIVLILLT